MLMPQVEKCTADDCFYWDNEICRANAIQIGDEHQKCDTYRKSEDHQGPADMGRVGACQTVNCEYNKQRSCSAQAIDVGCHDGHADCLTFEPR